MLACLSASLVMYIDGSPVLHVIDEGTRFQTARWLRNLSARQTWDTLRSCWVDTYVGPPNFIFHDAGKNFVSKEFRQYAGAMAIATRCVPVEAHWSIGIMERAHLALQRAYHVITEELKDEGISKDSMLQMAIKAVNDTAGPDGLVPTLLVFGAYPRTGFLSISRMDMENPYGISIWIWTVWTYGLRMAIRK